MNAEWNNLPNYLSFEEQMEDEAQQLEDAKEDKGNWDYDSRKEN